jgi:hypothetical protein
MGGLDVRTDSLFSYVNLEDRVQAQHPLRVIRRIVNDVLTALDGGSPSLRRQRAAIDCNASATFRAHRRCSTGNRTSRSRRA